MRISDWIRRVLFRSQSGGGPIYRLNPGAVPGISELIDSQLAAYYQGQQNNFHGTYSDLAPGEGHSYGRQIGISNDTSVDLGGFTIRNIRSEEHTSELQSLMRISYAVFCLKKNNNIKQSSISENI